MRRPDLSADAVYAALIGVALAVAIAAGGLAMLRIASQQSLPALTEATTTAADSVGRAVADQVGRALGYGIPLDRLYAVDRYFDTIVAGSPIVTGLALRDPSGRAVFETGPGLDGIAFPVMVDGVEAASLELAIAPPLVGPAIDRLRIALAATAALFGLIGGVTAYQVLAGDLGAGRRRLLGLMHDVLDDRYPAATPPAQGRGVVATATRACGMCLDELRRSAHTLNDAIATVRAIDFDGSLARRLEPIVAPVAAVVAPVGVEERPGAQAGQTSGRWLAVVAIGLYALAMPFVANFAIDRDWTHVGSEWWPVLPVVAEAAAGLVGFALVRRLLPGTHPLAAAAGLLAAGLATVAVAWARDYVSFLELRAVAAAGLGLAMAALTGHGSATRRPVLLGPLLFAAVLAGPLLGGLIGEALGRRMTFLVAGCLMLALVPVVLALLRTDRQGGVAGAGETRIARLLPAMAAGVVIGAVMLVWVPAGPGYDDYLAGGLLFAAIGATAALPLRSLAAGLVLAAVGMSVATYPGLGAAAPFIGMLLAGAGLRALLAAGPSRAGDAVPVFLAGTAFGAVSVGAAGAAGLPALVPGAAAVVVLAGIALAPRRRPARTPAA